MINEKLHCKGEPYWFSSQQDSSVHTGTDTLLYKINIIFVYKVSRAGSVCSGSEENDDREYAPDSGSSDDEETIEKEESQAKVG